MENILKIIYDKSIKNKILDINDINKILELLVVNKNLNDYISNICIQPIRSNNLASYSSYTKDITIYTKVIDIMIENIEKTILIANDFEISLYKNLSILQVILHEVEHAYQQKIAFTENNLESFIIRMSFLIPNAYEEPLYEYCPEERLAEIKSYQDILTTLQYLKNKPLELFDLLNTEKLQRLLRGYHYNNGIIEEPLTKFFVLGNKPELIVGIEPNTDILEERMKYGFSITTDEYGSSMNQLILSLNKKFKNRVNIK